MYAPGSLAARAVGTQIIRWPVTTTIWPPTSKLNDSTAIRHFLNLYFSKLTVGPDSVGYELVTKSLVYGGQTLTATDIAVAGGICNIGEPSKVHSLDTSLVGNVLSLIRELLENGIDQVKVKLIYNRTNLQ